MDGFIVVIFPGIYNFLVNDKADDVWVAFF